MGGIIKNMDKNLLKIKSIARSVYKSLGSGHTESVYDKAMRVGLRLAGLKYESQKVVELEYKGHYVGEGFPDIIVRFGRKKVILELKAVGGSMGAAEEQQLRNYMEILEIKHGILINFQQPGKKESKTKVEIKEVVL